LSRRLIADLTIAGLLGVLLALGASCKSNPSSAGRASNDSTHAGASSRRARKAGTASDSLAGKARSTAKGAAGKVAGAAGKVVAGVKGKHGTLQVQTSADKTAERKRLLEEKRQARRDLRRKRQEELIARRAQRTRGKRTGRNGSLNDANILKATIAGQYALIGSRRVARGDVIAGKRLVEIDADRIVLEQSGTTFGVRIGESVDRSMTTTKSSGR